MGRGSRSRAKRKKRTLKRIGLIAGIIAGIGAVLFFLAMIVAGDNNKACSQAGLRGGVFGCVAEKKYTYDNIYFVVGNTANSPAPYLSTKVLKIVQNSSYKKNPNIKIYSVSNRETISFRNGDEIEEKEESSSTIARIKKIKENLASAITKEPKTDGAQYYEAIDRAGHAIDRDTNSNQKSIIIVIGSGLSDGGILNFSGGNLLNNDPEQVVSSLLAKNAISDDDNYLKGVNILWSGAGQTVAPQNELSIQEKANLKNIYKSVLKASGVSKIDFEDDTNEDLPSIKTDKKVNVTPTSRICYFCDTKEFAQDELGGFVGGEYKINDEAKMSEITQKLESDMANVGGTIVIVGYRARGYCGDEDESTLPLDRANAVRDYIVSHSNISPDAIRTEDGGIGQIDECQNSGVPDPEAQNKNRKVTIRIER